jgi:acyl-CoA thioester hydrolase
MMKTKDDNGPYNIYAETEITVEFFDLDPLRIVWHGNYLNYFEVARRALLEKIGYSYDEMEKSGYAFPVIEISVKYLGSLRFRDKACVKAILMEYENRLLIRYEICNAQTGVLTTKGSSTQMAYDIKKQDSCFVCPSILIKKVEAFIEGEKQ